MVYSNREKSNNVMIKNLFLIITLLDFPLNVPGLLSDASHRLYSIIDELN